jgi:hypothetical protein
VKKPGFFLPEWATGRILLYIGKLVKSYLAEGHRRGFLPLNSLCDKLGEERERRFRK